VPAGTQSLALICHDFDVPSRGDDVNQPGREVPADLPRVDFFHWVLVDLPASLAEIREGEFSRAFTPRGKTGPSTLHGARHGLERLHRLVFRRREDERRVLRLRRPVPALQRLAVHHYVFTLYALGIERSPVQGAFTGAQVREAIYPHLLGAATHSGTYTLNKRLMG
jgi:phosphatidylethanolamine-binding protein (PEBP) family uncharacterized protein